MSVTTTIIVMGEVILVLTVGCALLFVHARRMRSLSSRLQERMQELVTALQESRAQQKRIPPATPHSDSYPQSLEKQLAATREYHHALADGHDIALDLDINAPIQRRIAALRYALLVAERDAQGNDAEASSNWEKLTSRYQQLLNYFASNDSETGESESPDSMAALQQELLSYQKRVVNLEKFKQLYFELEQRWESCSQEARVHYDELSEWASRVEDSDAFEHTLDNYQASYQGIADLVTQDSETVVAESASARAAQQATGEIRHLRNLAADQHRIIHNLQVKLAEATTQDEMASVVTSLQEELKKQMRYAQESETCIQLLEDELNSSHREVQQVQAKLKQVARLQAECGKLESIKEKQEQAVFALRDENQRLKNKLRKLLKQAATGAGASPESPELKAQLNQLKSKYAELEERYLKLKIKSSYQPD